MFDVDNTKAFPPKYSKLDSKYFDVDLYESGFITEDFQSTALLTNIKRQSVPIERLHNIDIEMC